MKITYIFALSLLLCIPALRLDAQQSQSGIPGQPLSPIDDRDTDSTTGQGQAVPQAQRSNPFEPDVHILSGAENIGAASLRYLGNRLDPSLFVWESGSTNTSSNKLESLTWVGGNLDVSRNSRRQQLNLSYSGGFSFDGRLSGFTNYHHLAISESISLGRWILRWGDQLMFSSQGSSFGGLASGGFTFGGQAGTVAPLQQSLVPNLTILTGPGRSLDDSAWGEADYRMSRQTTFTALASYAVLRFIDAGYISGEELGGRLGYNYAFDSKNTFTLFASYDRTRFLGVEQRVEDSSVRLGYGRTINSRLAFQAAGGPVLVSTNNYGNSGQRQVSWGATASLSYAIRRSTYAISYSYGLNMGSGVLFGSNSHIITASASRSLTRYWSGSLTAAYARNSALAPSTVFANRFDYGYANVAVGRQLGRQLQLGFNYGYQQQVSGGGSCPVVSCGTTSAWQVFGANLSWHPLLGKR